MNLKCFLGFHAPITDRRTFIEYAYKFDTHMGSQKYYVFIIEGYCLRCNKRFKAIQHVMWPFTYKQPYDINFPKE